MHSTNKFFLPLLVICLGFALSTGSDATAQKKWGGLETVPRFDPNSRVFGSPIEEKGTANIPPRTSSPRPGASDLGLQRPVSVKRRGFDYYLGISTRVYYSSNPTIQAPGATLEKPAGVWLNNLHSGFRLGSYNWGRAAFSPYLGLTLTRFDQFGDKELDFPLNTLGLYSFGLVQFQNGWAIRSGLTYNQDHDGDGNDRIHNDFYPGITLLKTFSLGKAISLIDFGIAHHFTDSKFNPTSDELDRWELSARWTVLTQLGKWELSPYARIIFSDYRKGNNHNRQDFSREVGLDIEYPFTKYLTANFFLHYATRLSKGGAYSYDFNRFDGGGGASLNAKF